MLGEPWRIVQFNDCGMAMDDQADETWTESVAQAVSMTSEDARAGIDAFFEKRKIEF